MENIFELRFSFEQKTKDEVIYKFSNKQGGSYNVFGYHWQCFVWAAVIGFLRDERRPLTPPIADKTFSLKTMRNNEGEKDAMALICLAIAKAGTLDVMKDPNEAITLINEYANGGFYHIMKLIANGENTFNDLEKVKQEIFSRDYDVTSVSFVETEEENVADEDFVADKQETEVNNQDLFDDEASRLEAEKPWKEDDIDRLKMFYENEMPISRISERLKKSLYSVQYQLALLGYIKMPLNVIVQNAENGGTLCNKSGEVVYSDDAPLKILNGKIYRFNLKSMCLTVKDILRKDGGWQKGGKMLVAYSDSELFAQLKPFTYLDKIEDFVEGEKREMNKIKYQGVWYNYYGDKIE